MVRVCVYRNSSAYHVPLAAQLQWPFLEIGRAGAPAECELAIARPEQVILALGNGVLDSVVDGFGLVAVSTELGGVAVDDASVSDGSTARPQRVTEDIDRSTRRAFKWQADVRCRP